MFLLFYHLKTLCKVILLLRNGLEVLVLNKDVSYADHEWVNENNDHAKVVSVHYILTLCEL